MGDRSYDYVLYIDEAGDPGLKKVKPRTDGGGSEWFVVAGALVAADQERDVDQWIEALREKLASPQLRNIHFAKLSEARKKTACEFLSKQRVRFFTIISNKQNLQGYRNPLAAQMTALLPSDNWFYCWMTRMLLERVTEFVAHHSQDKLGRKGTIKLIFSKRGGLRYSQMHAYFELINVKSAGGRVPLKLPWGKVDFETLKPDLMEVESHADCAGLKMADICASAFFAAIDVHDIKRRDATFAKILKSKMAADPLKGTVAGFGVKLMPSWSTLDRFLVSNDQREVFKFYGYPAQWWQS